MKALVTGGGGFLGRYIIEQLLLKDSHVRLLARGAYPELSAQGVECIRGTIENKPDVERACRGVDIVFHTAAKVGVFGRFKDFYRTNVIGTKNIIETCRSLGIGRLVYSSSSSVTYEGKNKVNADETDPYPKKFLSPYSQTKAAAEKMVLDANSSELLTVALRPHLIFGPGDKYIIPGILKKARTGRLRIIGGGKNLTDITYVENAAEAHLLAAKHLNRGSSLCGQAYYITQGKPVVLWDWVNQILKEMEIPLITRHIPFRLAYLIGAVCEGVFRLLPLPGEPPLTRIIVLQLATSHTYNISKAGRDFGFHPRISTEEGLQKTLSYFKRF